MTEALRNAHAVTDRIRARLPRRRFAERVFWLAGAGAVALAALILVVLLGSIASKGVSAFTQYEFLYEADLTDAPAGAAEDLRLVNFAAPGFEALFEQFPEARGDRALAEILSVGAGRELKELVSEDVSLIGQRIRGVRAPIAGEVDLFLKKAGSMTRTITPRLPVAPALIGDDVQLAAQANDFRGVISRVKTELRDRARAAERSAAVAQVRLEAERSALARIERRIERADADMTQARRDGLVARRTRHRSAITSLEHTVESARREADALMAQARGPADFVALSDAFPSFLVFINGGVVKLTEASATVARGEPLSPPRHYREAAPGDWRIVVVETPQSERLLNDQKVAWALLLKERNLLKPRFNHRLFTNATSTNPELAGVAGAMVGTLLTMIITMVVCFPIGVATAIYMEEFAPKNRITDFIEVNINNLAAVPSIIFGLLGLAVFLNVFGVPRGSAIAGGLVIALMTLPTIIIASRSALRAVPPSIREASLGLGASKTQTTFRQVLPLAAPGVLTGTIIGLAQAIGESAPLLMIGMSAFVADVPDGFTDRATVMPVQIFRWATNPERAFEERTSAAILLLLGLLVVINAVAIVLRRRFEKRW